MGLLVSLTLRQFCKCPDVRPLAAVSHTLALPTLFQPGALFLDAQLP